MDIQGRELAVLASGLTPAGRYQAVWNGRTDQGDAPAGLYFVKFNTPAGQMVKRLALHR